MRALTTIFLFSTIFALGFFTSNIMSELSASEMSVSLLSKYHSERTQIKDVPKKNVKGIPSNKSNSEKKISNTRSKKISEGLNLIEIMRSEIDLTDQENFIKYMKYMNKFVHNEIEGVDSRTVVVGTDVFKTTFFEGGQLETKIDEKGHKHWDKIKYDNGVEVYKGYDHFQRVERTISKFEGKRVSYTKYSPKNGEVKQRWVHLQNGDLLFSRYSDGIKTEFWKLPEGGDSEKDWKRAL